MQVANRICSRCHNANYVRYLGELSDSYKYKCINCNAYLNDEDFEQPMSEKMTIEETINGLQNMIQSKKSIEHDFDGVVDEDVCERAIELLKEQNKMIKSLTEENERLLSERIAELQRNTDALHAIMQDTILVNNAIEQRKWK